MEFKALTYKVPAYNKIIKAIITVLIVFFSSGVVSSSFADSRNGSYSPENYKIVLLIEAVIVIIALAYLARVFLFDNKTLVLVDDKIIFLNGKKVESEFSLYDCTVSSYIIRHPSGVDLKMLIHLQKGESLEMNCTRFGKKQFNEFMNEIDARCHQHQLQNDMVKVEKIETQQQVNNEFIEMKEFTLDKKDAMAISMTAFVMFGVIFAVLGVIVPILAFKDAGVVIGSLFGLIFFAPIVWLSIFQINLLKKSLLYVKITSTEVSTGMLVFAKEDIQKIIVTPPAYTSGGLREVVLITSQGTHKWKYGKSVQGHTQDQYYELVETLRLFMHDSVGVFEFKRV